MAGCDGDDPLILSCKPAERFSENFRESGDAFQGSLQRLSCFQIEGSDTMETGWVFFGRQISLPF